MREPLVELFGESLDPLTGDASTRRFYRGVAADGRSQIVMDYGAPFEAPSDDQRMTELFRAADLPVPEVWAVHPEDGCLCLEDLGDLMVETAVIKAKNSLESQNLIEKAVDLAIRIAQKGTPELEKRDPQRSRVLDNDRFGFEMEFFLENFVGHHLKMRGDQAELRSELFALAFQASETPHSVLCHRDYHSRNLMIRDDGSLAMVDIQDAQWGPDSYDLASLLFDAYIEIPAGLREGWVHRYCDALGYERDEFEHRFHLVAAQRMIKALGSFGYQIEVAQNDRYRSAIPRTLDRLGEWLPKKASTSAIHRLFERFGIYGG